MNKSSRTCKISGLALLVLCGVLVLASPGLAGLNYSGSLTGEEQKNGEILLKQSHNFGLNFSQELTNFISATEHARYSYNLQDQQPLGENLTESADLVTSNEIFRVNLSGYVSSSLVDGQKQSETQTLDLGFKGKWDNDFYPGLSFGASRSTVVRRASQTSLPDRETFQFDTTLDWMRSGLSLYYNYRFSEIDSGTGSLAQTKGAHNGNLKFSDSYWDNRLRLRFGQGYTLNSRDVAGVSTSFLWPITLAEVRTGSGLDSVPFDTIDDAVVNNLMNDTNLSITAYSVGASTSLNNIMLLLNQQTISEIHLYTNPGFSVDPGLTWALYSNNLPGDPWVPLAVPSVTYNVTEKRFEMRLAPVAAKYLKIVVNTGLDPVVFTEVQLFNNIVTSSATAEETTSTTIFSLAGVVSNDLTITYNANYKVSEAQGVSVFESDTLSQGVLLDYRPPDQMSTAKLSFNLVNAMERESRNYSFGVSKEILPTLSIGGGWGKSESYSSSLLLSESSNYSLSSTAQLYPDLDMRIRLGTTEAKSPQNTSSPASLSNSLSFAFTARLAPGIVFYVAEDITEQKKPVSGRSFKTVASFSWRISRMLSFSTHGSYVTTASGATDSTTLDSKILLALSNGARLSVSYLYTDRPAVETESGVVVVQGGVSHSGAASLRWSPKPWVGLEGGVRYRGNVAPDEQEFLAYGKLTVNFRLP